MQPEIMKSKIFNGKKILDFITSSCIWHAKICFLLNTFLILMLPSVHFQKLFLKLIWVYY